MWCPNCGREAPEGRTDCPECGSPLVEMVVAFRPPKAPQRAVPAAEPEFLLYLPDRRDLELAMDLLEENGIPYEIRPGSGGGYRRVTGGAGGGEIYVHPHFTHRALRLLRRFDEDAQAPFSDEELETAMDDFYTDYEPELEPEDPPEPVSPEGYRMVFVFLGIFALLVLAAVLFG